MLCCSGGSVNKDYRYYVDFWDMSDGWGTFGFFTHRLFSNLKLAKECCDALQSELNQNNKNCGGHYGVIDKELSREIYCTIYK